MVVYVAFIAILNLGLGYALAMYLGAEGKRTLSKGIADDEDSYSDDYEEAEYESDESYEADEYEAAAT